MKDSSFFCCCSLKQLTWLCPSAIASTVVKSAKTEEECLISPSKNWLLTEELLECARQINIYILICCISNYFIVMQYMLISTVEAYFFCLWFGVFCFFFFISLSSSFQDTFKSYMKVWQKLQKENCIALSWESWQHIKKKGTFWIKAVFK